jgi:hypothetical protein
MRSTGTKVPGVSPLFMPSQSFGLRAWVWWIDALASRVDNHRPSFTSWTEVFSSNRLSKTQAGLLKEESCNQQGPRKADSTFLLWR